jgi:flagellar biosynthetic protein FliR
MTYDGLIAWVTSCLLLGLRIGPVFAFAPPFTLVRLPRSFRILFGLGLAVCLVSAFPAATALPDYGAGTIVSAAARELMMGLVFCLAFQIVFAALYFAGRTIDVQAGYGLALLIDPTSQSQTPLVGTLFALAAGGIFFAIDGHLELVRLFAASLEAIPLGAWQMPHSIGRLTAFMGTAFLMAFGVAGIAVLVLFLADAVITMMSRTVPQMNVLILGIQVKTILLLAILPVTFAVGGSLLFRMMAMVLEALPGLF